MGRRVQDQLRLKANGSKLPDGGLWMVGARVHYEVFGRKHAASGWTLEMATEDRAGALKTAHELVGGQGYAGAKVTKETLDEETREFASVSILNLGAPEAPKKKPVREDLDPLCVQPQDLYTLHARERIGRLLE